MLPMLPHCPGCKETSTPRGVLLMFSVLEREYQQAQRIAEGLKWTLEEYFTDTRVDKKDIHDHLKSLYVYLGKLNSKYIKPASKNEEPSKCDLPSDQCANNCVDIIIRWLPKLHSDLWYLEFQTYWMLSDLGGYKWAEGRSGNTVGNWHLQNWLDTQDFMSSTSEPPIPPIPEESHGSIYGEAIDSLPDHVFTFITGISLYRGGPLNHTQFGLFLLSEDAFHHSNLASAILFLEEFCREVNRGGSSIFKSKMANSVLEGRDVETACALLSTNLKPFTGDLLNAIYYHRNVTETDGGTEDAKEPESPKEVPTSAQISSNMYEDKLKADALEKYITWIERNIANVVASMVKMKNDSSSWTRENLRNGKSRGPFKYGFVFRNSNWEEALKNKLTDAIDTLTESTDNGSLIGLLGCFKENLDILSSLEVASMPNTDVSDGKQDGAVTQATEEGIPTIQPEPSANENEASPLSSAHGNEINPSGESEQVNAEMKASDESMINSPEQGQPVPKIEAVQIASPEAVTVTGETSSSIKSVGLEEVPVKSVQNSSQITEKHHNSEQEANIRPVILTEKQGEQGLTASMEHNDQQPPVRVLDELNPLLPKSDPIFSKPGNEGSQPLRRLQGVEQPINASLSADLSMSPLLILMLFILARAL